MDRTDFDPEALGWRSFYQLLAAVVVPRPIAWVSTISRTGVHNLAPHSFFSVASTNPPIVQFTSVGRKDSLKIIEATSEFVVNFANEELFTQINATATDFPADVSEFDTVGVEREDSLRVSPPRVAGSPVALECRLHSTLRLGNGVVIFGQVVHAAVSAAALDGSHPEISRLRPLSRLGRDEWGEPPSTREISRIRLQDWPGHYRPSEDGA